MEEVAKAVGGGYCRLQMPLKLALAVRGTVAGHRLGALEDQGGGRRGAPSPSNAALSAPRGSAARALRCLSCSAQSVNMFRQLVLVGVMTLLDDLRLKVYATMWTLTFFLLLQVCQALLRVSARAPCRAFVVLCNAALCGGAGGWGWGGVRFGAVIVHHDSRTPHESPQEGVCPGGGGGCLRAHVPAREQVSTRPVQVCVCPRAVFVVCCAVPN